MNLRLTLRWTRVPLRDVRCAKGQYGYETNCFAVARTRRGALRLLLRMPDITSLIEQIGSTPDCSLMPATGLPSLPSGVDLPPDLRRFYELSGGCVIYSKRIRPAPARIVGPQEFERIDLTILGETISPGPFQFWFAIADVADGNYISIDLHPDHCGKCYDCFHETFTIPGYVNVIASSFTDLLSRLVHHTEDSDFWLEEDFQPLGEAFKCMAMNP